MKNKVFVLGNPLVQKDSLPAKIIPFLQKQLPEIDFMVFDPAEEFPDDSRDIILIDTVIGLKKVTVYYEFKSFKNSPKNSLHDFDLPLSLGLLKKLGKIEKVTIIGIPPEGSKKKISNQIVGLLKST